MNERDELPAVVVPEALDGARLDRALLLCLPGTGLRRRHRLWERYDVLVDGRPQPKGRLVRAGERIVLAPRPAAAACPDPADWPGLRVAAEAEEMAALCKPPGLDSAAVAGRPGASVEGFLPRIWPGREVVLLTRLDRPTSGLLLAAFGARAALRFRASESAGLVSKRYLAVVEGVVGEPLLIRLALDTTHRKKVRVLGSDDPDPARWTEATPLRRLPGLERTLLRVVIKKGARHQIRAHLASCGHPVAGDPLYGRGREADLLYLHHESVDMPGFSAACRPQWPDVEV